MKVIWFVLSLLLLSVEAGAQMKSWTDENGVTHYGNDPRPPVKQEPKVIQLECHIGSPEGLKSSDQTAFRRATESLLTSIADCQSKVEAAFIFEKHRDQIALAALAPTRNSPSIEDFRRAAQRSEAMQPVREIFLLVEKITKEKYGGALPAWLKDNREWRQLDKAFGP